MLHDIVLDEQRDSRLKHLNEIEEEKSVSVAKSHQDSPTKSITSSAGSSELTLATQVHLQHDEENNARTKIIVTVLVALVIVVTLLYALQLSTALFYVLVVTCGFIVLGVLFLLVKLVFEKCFECINGRAALVSELPKSNSNLMDAA